MFNFWYTCTCFLQSSNGLLEKNLHISSTSVELDTTGVTSYLELEYDEWLPRERVDFL